jgi:DNA repair exonuclease SbcCD ATPase subunit
LILQCFITEKEFEEKTKILQEYVSGLVYRKERDATQSENIQEALYGHYNHMYLNEKREMETIMENITTIQMELQRHHEYKKERDELAARIDSLTKLCEMYTKYQTSLNDMYDILVGTRENPFGIKEWIQRENIIPYLIDRINPMLKYFGMTMEIECIKGRYDFFVKDVATGMSMIHERASGFQKTIVNLAMRTTLLNMNPSKIRMGQMFIDEGFTSCDSENIKHMPVLIRYFLNFYENIFLVSHQDDVQETADVVVNVVKKDGISFFEDVVKTCL